MGRWWRAYDEALDDPKLQRLSPELFRCWFNLLCIASKNKGTLPSMEDLAFQLRIYDVSCTKKMVEELRQGGLIDETFHGTLQPHNWRKRQYKSDNSTARVKRFRKRRETVTETAPEQSRTETDTETDKGSKKYAFESGVIRLTEKDLTAWIAAFSYLDVKAELTGASRWASEQKNWFNAVSSLLAKRNREAKLALEKREKPRIVNWRDAIA